MTSNKLWNTGVDDHGTPLAPTTKYGIASIDPHCRLIQGPNVTNPQNVYVLAEQNPGGYFVTPDSMWVWADPRGKGD